MTIRKRDVSVHQVPEQGTTTKRVSFLRDLQIYAETERPRVVLDCSDIRNMDNTMLHLLLSCLEEVMKRNGDVRLAALRPDVEAALRFEGVDRLFEIYPTAESAVNSFHRRPNSLAPLYFEPVGVDLRSEHAA